MLFVSQSHYSILGAGSTMGMGTENVKLVDVDHRSDKILYSVAHA